MGRMLPSALRRVLAGGIASALLALALLVARPAVADPGLARDRPSTVSELYSRLGLPPGIGPTRCTGSPAGQPSPSFPAASEHTPSFGADTLESEAWDRVRFMGFILASLIVDPVRDRLVLYGGIDGNGDPTGDVWVKPVSGEIPWTRLEIPGLRPPVRATHTAIYDPVRDRMMVYGGTSADGPGGVWALDLANTPAWSELTPEGAGPGTRSGARAIYDPAGDRMLVFGGYVWESDTLGSDVWALSLSGVPTWTLLSTRGTPPNRRTEAAAIYDPVRQRMVVFGGWGQNPPASGAALADVWALTLADSLQWTELHAEGDSIPGLFACGSAYDSARDRMLVYGGDGRRRHGDVWALRFGDPPSWVRLTPPAPQPSPRASARAIYDRARDRLVMFGGTSGGDTWALSFGGALAWTELEAGDGYGPLPRQFHSAEYDSTLQRVLVFGGVCVFEGTGRDYRYLVHNDLWSLTLGPRASWVQVSRDSAPPGRYGHVATLDPVADRMIVFGGVGLNPPDYEGPSELALDDLWQLPLGGTQPWSRIEAEGSPPPARFMDTAIYDPPRRRMLVFGGRDFQRTFGDLWALSLDGPPRWTPLDVTGAGPGPRYGHRAVYDPVGDRMILFGGRDGATYFDDTWQLSLAGASAWSLMSTPIRPPGRALAMMVYDPHRERLVLFGGEGTGSMQLGDTWVLPLAAGAGWIPTAAVGDPPHPREGPAGVFDPDRDRVVLLQGSYFPYLSPDLANADHDVWTMASADTVPAPLAPPRVEAHPLRVTLHWQSTTGQSFTAVVQRRTNSDPWLDLGTAAPDGAGRIDFTDLTARPATRYAYRLNWSVGAAARTTPEVWVDVPGLRFALAGATPNPTARGLTISFSLPDDAPARLDLIDIAGRQVLSRDVGGVGPGDHALDLAGPGALAPGVYLVRLARGGVSLVTRACVLR